MTILLFRMNQRRKIVFFLIIIKYLSLLVCIPYFFIAHFILVLPIKTVFVEKFHRKKFHRLQCCFNLNRLISVVTGQNDLINVIINQTLFLIYNTFKL